MQTTTTRFGTFAEPELLGAYTVMTAPTLTDRTDDLVERIDDVLGLETELRYRDTPAWTQTRTWTRSKRRQVSISHMMSQFITNAFADSSPADDADWVRTIPAVTVPAAPIRSADYAQLAPPLTPDEVQTSRPRVQLDSSLEDVQRWLGIGLEAATDAAGIARSTVYAWRARSSVPRPATVSAVLRVHGLVASAVKAVGESRARAWFHAGDPSPLAELVSAKGDATKISKVSARLRRELVAVPLPPPDSRLAVTIDDLNR